MFCTVIARMSQRPPCRCIVGAQFKLSPPVLTQIRCAGPQTRAHAVPSIHATRSGLTNRGHQVVGAHLRCLKREDVFAPIMHAQALQCCGRRMQALDLQTSRDFNLRRPFLREIDACAVSMCEYATPCHGRHRHAKGASVSNAFKFRGFCVVFFTLE